MHVILSIPSTKYVWNVLNHSCWISIKYTLLTLLTHIKYIFRIQSIELALHEKERQLKLVENKYQKLKADFVYNLQLLGERDAELARYDNIFERELI